MTAAFRWEWKLSRVGVAPSDRHNLLERCPDASDVFPEFVLRLRERIRCDDVKSAGEENRRPTRSDHAGTDNGNPLDDEFIVHKKYGSADLYRLGRRGQLSVAARTQVELDYARFDC